MDVKTMSGSTSCPSGYENIGKAYWWGTKLGCTCASGKYAQVRREVCTDTMRKDYCKDTKRRDARWLDVIKGKNICGKRSESSLT